MKLRTVDPASLKEDPANPRRMPAGDVADKQLTANILAVGILQPPVVRPDGDGLVIIAGRRRVRCAIAAGLDAITVLVRGADDGSDAVRAISENVVRAPMTPVDQWRAIEALVSDHWTEDAIGTALALPVRTIRKLRLLANIHPAILDQMNRGDMPEERYLRIIAAATPEEQAVAWKKNKPKKGEATAWWQLAQVLEKRRMHAKDAKFGAPEEQAFGIAWTEDLFAPADDDSRTTDQIDAFLAAQQAWLEANLPKKGVILTVDEYGRPDLPRGAIQTYGKPGKGDTIGCHVDPRSGAIREIAFKTPKPKNKKGDDDADVEVPVKTTRPDISRKGQELIGEIRTEALHKALLEAAIDDSELLALFVLALAGSNVMVEGPTGRYSSREGVAQQLVQGTVVTGDVDAIRAAARRMLTEILSCRLDRTGSGLLARIAGDAIHADAYLPNMATEELLSCLTKKAVEAAASAENVAPRPRAKDTRAALIERYAGGTYVLPTARFAVTAAEAEDLADAEFDEHDADAPDMTDGARGESGDVGDDEHTEHDDAGEELPEEATAPTV
jgi:ParB family chromosome partitioning protein